MKETKILYYVSETEREGSWQRSGGYILSDNEACLKKKIVSLPKYSPDLSLEFSKIKSFEPTEKGYEHFCRYACEGILAIDDFEMKKFWE
jgi:hypothetical protein